MSTVKSFDAGRGDMFYIDHGSPNFTIVDCNFSQDSGGVWLDEIVKLATNQRNQIVRFISTHPDQDHFSGLCELDERLNLANFYCVDNAATKDDETSDFLRYKSLRDDGSKAFHIYAGCKRKWMNVSDDTRGQSGISVLWPVTGNERFRDALDRAARGESPNNISAVLRYSVENSGSIAWFGDLETSFMESISDAIELTPTTVVFAPHHGRSSGTLPTAWLDRLEPKVIILGNAPSNEMQYYGSRNTISQNSAGHITLELRDGAIDFFVSSPNYSVEFLEDQGRTSASGHYVGTLAV